MVRLKMRLPMLFTLLVAFAILSCGGNGGDKSKTQTQANKQMNTSASQNNNFEKGDPQKGETLFIQNCSACHGQNAKGIQGVGKDLINSQFVAEQSDQQLLQYVKQGRTVDDPRNTTGIPMPPKGGNPALTHQQIMHIIAYLRELRKAAGQN